MKNSDFQEHAVDAMITINAAIQNLRLYPASSTPTINAINKAYRCILKVLEHEDPLVFGESERNLLICGELLGESEQKSFLVEAFLELLINLGIKTITFTEDLEEAEFRYFLEAVTCNPEELSREGGLKEVIAKRNIRHILLGYKVYVAIEKDKEIFSKDGRKINIEESFVPMVHTLDYILDNSNRDKVSHHLATSMANMDVKVLSTILTQDTESEFGEKLFSHILHEMGDEKLEMLAVSIKRILDTTLPKNEKYDPAKVDSIKQAYQKMMRSEMGKRLRIRIKEKQEQEKAKKEKKIAGIKAGLNSILKGEAQVFMDKQVMRSLPNTIVQMFARGNEKTACAIIDRLGAGLLSREKEARASVSEALLIIIDKFSPERRLETVDRLSDEIIGWVKLENASSHGYEKICNYLKTLALDHIQKKQFSEYHRIFETFQLKQNGKIQKEDETQFSAAVSLYRITSEDILNLLLEEFQTNEEKKRDQVIPTLIQMGGASAGPLLDLLNESRNRSERARIVQIISEIGPLAIPALTEKIRDGGPWYYLRNLVLLLGKIGNESHLKFFQPLLTHEDYRVQRESLNSIYAIGGRQRTEILLPLLSTADDRLKADIVVILGALKCDEAVPLFLEMLESKTIITPKTKNALGEKICNVLGSLGSQEAIPTLRSIVEQKRSLIGKRAYSEKVQIAAEKALAIIQGKTSPEE